MKKIPASITILRIVLSFGLLAVGIRSPYFLPVYLLCGLTDILDGYLARKWSVTSLTGAILDSGADLVFIMVVLVLLTQRVVLSRGMLLWIGGIAMIRIVAILVCRLKHGRFASLHTYANKGTGLLLFLSGALLPFADITKLASILCLAASLSAVEELLIQLVSKELNPDIKGIWSLHSK